MKKIMLFVILIVLLVGCAELREDKNTDRLKLKDSVSTPRFYSWIITDTQTGKEYLVIDGSGTTIIEITEITKERK